MRVFVANFGRQNYEWPICRERGTVATMNAVDAQKYWEAGDREAYVSSRMTNDTTAAGKKPTKATASRWFNLMTTVAETEGDVWVHKDGNEIWWTTSRGDVPSYETKREPIERGREVVVCHKPCDPWVNTSKKGVPLRWNELHPKAKDFLSTEATLQSLNTLYRDYTLAMIAGDDLSQWHDTPLWKKRSETAQNGYAPIKYGMQADKIAYQRAWELFEAADAAERMTRTAVSTANSSNGQSVDRIVKKKDLKFPSAAALQDYVTELMGAQEYCCELTGLPLVLDEINGDPAMFASLDRIDSSKHYEPGNLQVVCRFANFWKGASDDTEFRRLIEIVRSSVRK